MSTASVLQAAAGTFSTVENCLTPSTAFLTAAKPCNSFLSFPARSIRVFHLSCASSVSLARHHFLLCHKRRGPLVPLVAQTSDWAQQGGSQVEEASADEAEAGEADISDWDEEEGTVGVENVMGAAAEEEEAEASGDVTAEEEGYQEPPADAKLFVGNLPYDMDSEKLAHLFEEAGVVEVAEVIYNRETEQSRGFGFVTMSTVEEAEQAIEKFHRYDIDGRLFTVNKAAPRGSRPERTPREFEPSFRIYVGNLPWSVDDAHLEQAFSEYGKVVASRVVYERETGRSRGFGFVTMSTQQEMDDAIAGLDGNDLGGRTVRVNAAEQRPPRGSF